MALLVEPCGTPMVRKLQHRSCCDAGNEGSFRRNQNQAVVAVIFLVFPNLKYMIYLNRKEKEISERNERLITGFDPFGGAAINPAFEESKIIT